MFWKKEKKEAEKPAKSVAEKPAAKVKPAHPRDMIFFNSNISVLFFKYDARIVFRNAKIRIRFF